MSSNLVYNLHEVIHKTDLENMQLITDFTMSTPPDSKEIQFQSILFLIQNNRMDINGFGEGKKYLEKITVLQNGDRLNLKNTKRLMPATFENISCFLMPQKTNEPTFKHEMITLVSKLFDPSNLKVKKINGHELTANEFVDLVDMYFEALKSPDLLKNKTFYDVTVDLRMNILVTNLLELYKKNIENFKDFSKPNFQEYLRSCHELVKDFVMLKFQVAKKMGGKEIFRKGSNELEEKIEEYYKESRRETMRIFYESSWKMSKMQRDIQENQELKKVLKETRDLLMQSQKQTAFSDANRIKAELNLTIAETTNYRLQEESNLLKRTNKKLRLELSEKRQELTNANDEIIHLKNEKYLKHLDVLQKLQDDKESDKRVEEQGATNLSDQINVSEILGSLKSCVNSADEARKAQNLCDTERVQLRQNLDGLFQQITKEKRNFDVIFKKVGDWSEFKPFSLKLKETLLLLLKTGPR